MISVTPRRRRAALALVVTGWITESVLLAITMPQWVSMTAGLVQRLLKSVLAIQSEHTLRTAATVISVGANFVFWLGVYYAFMCLTFRVIDWGWPSESLGEIQPVLGEGVEGDSCDVEEPVDSTTDLAQVEGCVGDTASDFGIAASIYNEGMRIGREIFAETYMFGNSDEVFMKTYLEGLELLRTPDPSASSSAPAPSDVIDGEVIEIVEVEQPDERPAGQS
ncbi:Uncharacterised protein [Mycobacteroides abscessus subsp. massiliense]|uniref:hypothetical protein n=1 Tax=Mycobacteroides abscessus TaxID=36809 RepID=UPI0009C9FEFC|nr:hypothetical protein [Mycobacteroides abscessus]SKT52888.1 Uncharacterised protein [Mycobacteroides abscessus subsp. massiliense]